MKPVKQRISIVMSARDENPVIVDATIRGLLSTSSGNSVEIIVVDDGSQLPLTSRHREVAVARNPRPMGVSRAWRLGASIATGEVLIFMDPHMTFDPGWLDEMLAQLNPGVLLCSAWMNYGRTRTHCWGCDLIWNRGFEFSQRRRRPKARATKVPLVVGACYMLHQQAYQALGGFSPLFRVWGVLEQDISIRAWMAGLTVKCVTRSGVGHLDRAENPNPVYAEHVIHNQLALIRTVFEETTVPLLEELLAPVPAQVERWFSPEAAMQWRAEVQSKRQMSDAEFFRRLVKNSPLAFNGGARIKRGYISPGGLISAVKREELALTRELESAGAAPVNDNGVLCGTATEPAGPIQRQGISMANSGATDPAVAVQAFGVRFAIQASDASLLTRLSPALPWGWRPCGPRQADILYSIRQESEHADGPSCDYYALYKGSKRLSLTTEYSELLDVLRTRMETDLAENCASHVFVQAAVVEWKHRAIIIPGNELTGKRAFAVALIKAGAGYYSDKFAVFDAQGRVHPYARAIVLHGSESDRLSRWSVDALGGRTGLSSLPVGMVACIRYEAGKRWRVHPISTADALVHLLLNAAKVPARREAVFEILGLASRDVLAVEGTRGHPDNASLSLLNKLNKAIMTQMTSA